MSQDVFHLNDSQVEDLLLRYRHKAVPSIDYGTVADYCDGFDFVPFLPRIQGDLKDLQRPTGLKTILALCPPGSSLLEVGAGEPHVAQMLVDLGYQVTVVDPYDGSGRGPTEFEYYSEKYPNVRLVRSLFSNRTDLNGCTSFDCIYSISVLEHVHQPLLDQFFDGINHFLRPGGYSLHLIDHVLAGDGADFHLSQLAEILRLQESLAGNSLTKLIANLHRLIVDATADTETYYLSAEGHNRWRGETEYRLFPFRKVISVHSCVQRQMH